MAKFIGKGFLNGATGGFRENTYPKNRNGGQQIFFSKNQHGLMICDNTKNRALKQARMNKLLKELKNKK